MNGAAQEALDEFAIILPGLQAIRNQGVHGVIIADTKDRPLFHLRSKDRSFTKADLFACEEFTNYCARIAYAIRSALWLPADTDRRPPLLERPALPKVLEPYIRNAKKADRQL
jgi:hypothetical protein